MARFLLAALAASFAFLATPSPNHAAQLTSVGVQDSASLPRTHPSWPVPNDRNQVFYLQRSTNKNTVVYAARFDDSGNLVTSNPAQVYWRRYEEGGGARGLKRIENVAFGLNARQRSTPGEVVVTLRRVPQIPMLLRQTGANQAELWVNIGGKTVQAIYAYAEIDQSGLIDSVSRFTVYGRDPATGRYLSETYSVSGGAVRQ